MAWVRPRVLLALAWRDVLHEMRGRRGWVFVVITIVLMLPVAFAPRVSFDANASMGAVPRRIITVTGDVPPDMHDNDKLRPVEVDAEVELIQPPDGGPLHVRGGWVPRAVRHHLDKGAPAVRIERVFWKFKVPNRSALLALLSAAVLTGAVSESIGGERTRRTLETLLTAAITRHELIIGKWLAWTGYGAGAALLAALVTVVQGRVDLGLWLLPMPTVAGFTVALGLYLNRRARDVVSGATVSLRWMPAVLALSAGLSWWIGLRSPILAALVPLGGALMTAGATWDGIAPPLLATASTLAATALLLDRTARDLAQDPGMDDEGSVGVWAAIWTALIGALACWPALLGPMLWGPAGNYAITESLSPTPGVLATALGMLLLVGVRAFRTTDAAPELGLSRPDGPLAPQLMLGLLAGILLAAGASAGALVPMPETAWLADARLRMGAAVEPAWAGAFVATLAIVAQELLFRGWLQRHAGPVLAVLTWVVVMHPLDPLGGLLLGGTLAAVTALAGGSVAPALLARAVWSLIGSLEFAPTNGALAAAAGLCLLTGLALRRVPTTPAEGPPSARPR